MKIVRDAEGKKGFPYIAYIPDGAAESPALIIQLHGSGERGKGGDELDRVLIHGLPNHASDEVLKDCILLLPQCPEESFWTAKTETLKSFTELFAEEYGVDRDRIYLCGLSMGGYGTWYFAEAYPKIFAAIAPCCGGGMAWNAGVLTMPVKAFHGLKDTAVRPENTIEMIEYMKSCGLQPECVLYEDVGHDSWKRAFTPELVEWFFKHRRK